MKFSSEPFSISENVIPLKGKVLNTYWVYYAVRDKQKFEEYRRHWMELIAKQLVIPAFGVSEQFEHLVKKPISKQEDNIRHMAILARLRDTLLPKLLSGKIRIPDAEKLAAKL